MVIWCQYYDFAGCILSLDLERLLRLGVTLPTGSSSDFISIIGTGVTYSCPDSSLVVEGAIVDVRRALRRH